MQVISEDSDIRTFGMTSGAAPLVTGVVADIKSVRPDLSSDEILTILETTAFNVEGFRYLNAYRAIETVLTAHPTAPSFEEGRTTVENADNTCEAKRKGLEIVRQSAFVTNSKKSWEWLAEFYRAQGFLYNSAFYRRLAQESVAR